MDFDGFFFVRSTIYDSDTRCQDPNLTMQFNISRYKFPQHRAGIWEELAGKRAREEEGKIAVYEATTECSEYKIDASMGRLLGL